MTGMKRAILFFLAWTFLLGFSSSVCARFSASIQGSVKDSSGAAVTSGLAGRTMELEAQLVF
jgi:hypothetical protein